MNNLARRILEKIQRQFSLIVAKGKITRSHIDEPQVEFFPGEAQDSVPLYQHYGFKSFPPKDTTCIAVSGGNRNSSVILATKVKDEPKLNEGEACLYSDKSLVKVTPNQILFQTRDQDLGKLISELISIVIKIKVTNGATLAPDDIAKLNILQQKWSRGFVSS